MREKAVRVCAVCGKEFRASPSSGKLTCSKVCESKRRAGIADPDRLADGRGRMIAAERENPESSHMAKSWIVRDPSGKTYEVTNLKNWVYTSGLFEGEEAAAYTQFVHIRQTVVGTRTKNPAYSWHGWTLAGFGEGNYIKRQKPAKTCPVCGKTFSGRNGHAVYCSETCRLKARSARAMEKYHEKKTEDKDGEK